MTAPYLRRHSIASGARGRRSTGGRAAEAMITDRHRGLAVGTCRPPGGQPESAIVTWSDDALRPPGGGPTSLASGRLLRSAWVRRPYAETGPRMSRAAVAVPSSPATNRSESAYTWPSSISSAQGRWKAAELSDIAARLDRDPSAPEEEILDEQHPESGWNGWRTCDRAARD